MSLLVWLLAILFRFSSVAPADDMAAEPVEPPAPVSSEPFPADLGPVRTQAAIEDRFLSRSPIAACGVVRTGASGESRPEDYACLQQAADAGAPAELIVSSQQPDGTVLVYYRVNPGGPLEIFVDRRQAEDRPAWIYRRCPVPDDIRSATCD